MDLGSVLSSVAREFGIGKTTMADIKKAEREKVIILLLAEMCEVRANVDDVGTAMHTAQANLV